MKTLRGTMLALAALPAWAEYASVRGARLYYELHGAADAPPIVLLHGGMHSAAMSFAKQIPAFARTRRVIAIEQMGHGHSPDVAGRALTYEAMSEDTAALLKHIAIRDADVVGWSDGGQIALRLAFTHPELVRRAVASGVGFGASPAMRARLAAADVTAFFPAARADYAKVSPDGAEHWKVLGEKCRAMWAGATWGFTTAELGRIARPVLIVAGDRDTSGVEEAVRVFRAIPGAQLYIVPGTGHFTFGERPEWMNRVTEEFLNR
ncbi:MAG: alpha/beta fold hydrolase [Bryobacterales bacterium]|nr:alpha/beta fold hydrolase [Bryobacterales bacterium]